MSEFNQGLFVGSASAVTGAIVYFNVHLPLWLRGLLDLGASLAAGFLTLVLVMVIDHARRKRKRPSVF